MVISYINKAAKYTTLRNDAYSYRQKQNEGNYSLHECEKQKLYKT